MLKMLKRAWNWWVNTEQETLIGDVEEVILRVREQKANRAAAKLMANELKTGTVMLLEPGQKAPIVVYPTFRAKRHLAAIIVQAQPCPCGATGCTQSVFAISRFGDLTKFEEAARTLPLHAKARFVTIEREIMRLLDPTLFREEQYELFEKLFTLPQVKPSEAN